MPTRLVAREPREKFEDPEGLRALLDRLHAALQLDAGPIVEQQLLSHAEALLKCG